MSEAPGAETVKRGLHRVVLARTAPDGARVVVKRFASRGLLRRLGDGARARRELAVMRALAAAGVPVPRALEVRRVEGARELVQEQLDGARTLAALLRARRPRAGVACCAARATSAARSPPPATPRASSTRPARGQPALRRRGRAHWIDFGRARVRPPLAARRAWCATS
ncbi:MAG: hypothetical protein H6828_01660 [Planctomycetes bacterium]|nr:hypothetical protein [Planctomycetota bacterium]